MTGVVLDLDGVLGDTRPLWQAWLADAARRYRSIAALDPAMLPDDRAAASDLLDGWAQAGVGDWRAALERFAEDHAALYLRPRPEVTAALRRLQERGVRIAAFTDAPERLAHVAIAHVGARRLLEHVATGADALERATARVGPRAEVVRTTEELTRLATDVVRGCEPQTSQLERPSPAV